MERHYLAIRDTADQAGRLQDYLDRINEYPAPPAQEVGKDLLKKAPWIGAAYAGARKYMP